MGSILLGDMVEYTCHAVNVMLFKFLDEVEEETFTKNQIKKMIQIIVDETKHKILTDIEVK